MRGTIRAVHAALGFMLVLVGISLAVGTWHVGWLAVAGVGALMVAVDLMIEGRS